MAIVHYYRMSIMKPGILKSTPCSEEEYLAWVEKCKADPFYATSHAGDYRRMFEIDVDD